MSRPKRKQGDVSDAMILDVFPNARSLWTFLDSSLPIKEGDLPRAVEILKTDNMLPGVTGRYAPKKSSASTVAFLRRRKKDPQ